MGVGLQPLEFTECLSDSPQFRENLQRHEKELERTSQQIKRLIKEVKDVVQAARRLGSAQLALATSMEQFEFACIGASMTEDERVISRSLHHFAALIRTIEDERDRMLGRAHEQIIQPLEKFRKEHIGAVKEGKKKFDKKTAKFWQTQERTLSLSTKKPENVFQEADAALDMAERDFCAASLEYVFQLQAVQERKKFELVETLLGFVFGWWTFHHTAHDVHADAQLTVQDLQLRIQRTRSNFEETSKKTELLMKKMMEMRQMSKEEEAGDEGGVARAGYLFLMEKKAFGTAWTKQYAQYTRATRVLHLAPAGGGGGPLGGGGGGGALGGGGGGGADGGGGGGERVVVGGARPCADPPERRFCWECVPADPERATLTLQARAESDRQSWLRALQSAGDGRLAPPSSGAAAGEGATRLDANGFEFVGALIAAIEARSLTDQGLYRVGGVASRTAALLALWTTPDRLPPLEPPAWEARTLTSALKAFLRALPDALLTRRLHAALLAAAKSERRGERVAGLRRLVGRLPPPHRRMLRLVLAHLRRVAARADRNLMSASNLAVCFGPTLLRCERETVASILDLKFYNVVVETLLDHFVEIFDDEPDGPPAPAAPPALPEPPPPPHAASPSSIPMSARSDIGMSVGVCVGGSGPASGGSISISGPISAGGSGGGPVARFSPHHHQLLHHFTAPLLAGVGRSSSSSAESVSGHSASPPLRGPAGGGPAGGPAGGAGGGAGGTRRVRTLYACLGESEGELSFEPNQVISRVAPSGEPGWLRGELAGRVGLVPENYVEPLP